MNVESSRLMSPIVALVDKPVEDICCTAIRERRLTLKMALNDAAWYLVPLMFRSGTTQVFELIPFISVAVSRGGHQTAKFAMDNVTELFQ